MNSFRGKSSPTSAFGNNRSLSNGGKGKSVSQMFAEFQGVKSENLREVNHRKQRETVLITKLFNSFRNSQTKEFVLLEEKFQMKKKEFLNGLQEKIERIQDKIEKARTEKNLLEFKIASHDELAVISRISARASNLFNVPLELSNFRLNHSNFHRIHAEVGKIIKESNEIDLAGALAKGILEMQQKRLKVIRDSEKLKLYREDLQKSLNS
jgi:hypothetical protein